LRVAQRKEARTVAADPSLEHKTEDWKHSNSKPEARRQEVREDLTRLTDQLSLMAHWREQLQAEIDDNHTFLDAERFDSLTRRVRLFCEAADSICDTLGGRP
jgi:hypothetical protein